MPSNDYTMSFRPALAGPHLFIVPRIDPSVALTWEATELAPFYDVWRFTNPGDASPGSWTVEWVYAFSNTEPVPAAEPRTQRINIPAKAGTFIRFQAKSPWQAILIERMRNERGVIHPIAVVHNSQPNQPQHPMGGGGHGGSTAGRGGGGTQMVSAQGGGGPDNLPSLDSTTNLITNNINFNLNPTSISSTNTINSTDIIDGLIDLSMNNPSPKSPILVDLTQEIYWSTDEEGN